MLDVALDVLHHHDRIVDDDADGEHQAEQRQHVDRKAECPQHRERAYDGHGHGDQRDQRGTPGLQEQHHDDHHERHRLKQRHHDLADGLLDEDRRVVDHRPFEAFGKAARQLSHLRAHRRGELDRVGARRLEDGDRRGVLVVEQRAQRVALRAELDAGHVAQPGNGGARRLQHDLAELLGRGQSPLGIHRQLQHDAVRRRRAADGARRDLHVLLADRLQDVAGGEPAGGGLLGIDPHAHRIGTGTEGDDLAYARQARDLVAHPQAGEVRQVKGIVAPVRRIQVHDHRQGRRGLHRGHAQRPHRRRQPRQYLRDPVLHLDRSQVHVGAGGEGNRELHDAVGTRRRLHVDHALDAVDRLLEGTGHGVGDGAWVRAGIGRGDLHRRRHHVRVLAHRQVRQRDQAGDQDQRGQHRRQDRPVDEDP